MNQVVEQKVVRPPVKMTREQAAEFCHTAPLYCWASIHMEGSGHPPHVHSDSAVTGTYYVSVPSGTAPLCLEDPRGRSPFDVLSGIESELRYNIKNMSEAPPPFDVGYSIQPTAGDIVLFPPWLVHSVPNVETDEVRISFSFNLKGPWEFTAHPLGKM